MADLDELEREARRNALARKVPRPEPVTPPTGWQKPGHVRHDSPPPPSLPPSVKEQQQLARKLVELQEANEQIDRLTNLVEQLVQQRVDVTQVPTARHGFDFKGFAMVLTALGGLGLGGWATSKTSTTAEKVEVHERQIVDESKKTEVAVDSQVVWRTYAIKMREAAECRFAQTASALEKSNGYRVGFTTDGVSWQSVCLDDPHSGKWCKSFTYKAEPCPPMPDPPK